MNRSSALLLIAIALAVFGVSVASYVPALLSAPTTESDIARLAYALYLARGCEPGHDVDDWLQAERELRDAQVQTPRKRCEGVVTPSEVTANRSLSAQASRG